jgi:hypothetical protein
MNHGEENLWISTGRIVNKSLEKLSRPNAPLSSTAILDGFPVAYTGFNSLFPNYISQLSPDFPALHHHHKEF